MTNTLAYSVRVTVTYIICVLLIRTHVKQEVYSQDFTFTVNYKLVHQLVFVPGKPFQSSVI
jgi:hypothetical protein